MQRLFSMFPTGWPGIALLILRIGLGATLLPASLGLPPTLGTPWIGPTLVTLAIALCAGFLTPVTSVLCVGIQLAAWHYSSGGLLAIHICAILVGAALAMLGPGGYSLDARMFGRRQIIRSSRGGGDRK